MSNAAQPKMRYDIYGDEKSASFSRKLLTATLVDDDQSFNGSGWTSMDQGPGLTETRNQNLLHVQWFGFATNGRATWFVAPGCQLTPTGRSCAGDLYQQSVSGVGTAVSGLRCR